MGEEHDFEISTTNNPEIYYRRTTTEPWPTDDEVRGRLWDCEISRFWSYMTLEFESGATWNPAPGIRSESGWLRTYSATQSYYYKSVTYYNHVINGNARLRTKKKIKGPLYFLFRAGTWRIDEPATGAWLYTSVTSETIEWQTLFYGHMYCSNPDYNRSTSGLDSGYCSFGGGFEILEDYSGTIQCIKSMTLAPGLFTPGNELIIRRGNSADITPTSGISVSQHKLYACWHPDEPDKAFNHFRSEPDYVPDSWPEGIQLFGMTGFSEGPCDGIKQVPASPIEVMWAGKGCVGEEALRNTAIGTGDYLMGLLIDEIYPESYHFDTRSEESTDPGGCDPVGDNYIHSVNFIDGEETIYSLKGHDNMVFGDGKLIGSTLPTSSDTAKAWFDIETDDYAWKFVGPKTVYYEGPSGDLWHEQSYNNDTGYWEFQDDPHNLWVNPTEERIEITEGYYLQYELQNGERTTGELIETRSVPSDVHNYIPVCQLGYDRMVYLRFVANGGNYDTYRDIWKFNFTTFHYELESSVLLYQTEPNPTEYSICNARMLWIPDHTALNGDGTLLIGEPHYTGNKSEQGRILRYTWVQSTGTLTAQADLTTGVRNGHNGLCIGWSKWRGQVITTEETEGLCAFSTTTWAYLHGLNDRNSGIGIQFCVADNVDNGDYGLSDVMGGAWNLNDGKWRIYHFYSTSISQSGLTGNGNSNDYTAVRRIHFENGLADVKGSIMGANTDNTLTSRTYPSYSSNYGWNMTSGRTGNCAWSWLYATTDRVFYHSGPSTFYATNPTRTLSTGIPTGDIWNGYFKHCITAFNGTDDEWICVLQLKSDFTEVRGWMVRQAWTEQPHIEVGEWYFTAYWDVKKASAIVNRNWSLGFSLTYSTNIKLVWKPDDSLSWYTHNSSTDQMDAYATQELALAAAESVSTLTQAAIQTLNIVGTHELQAIFYLEKWYSESYPLVSPQVTDFSLLLTAVPLTEPRLLTHFSDDTTEVDYDLKQVYRDTSGNLNLVPNVGAYAGFLDIIASGSHVKRLLT